MGFIYGGEGWTTLTRKSFADDEQVWLQSFSMVQDQRAS